ncbi:MAG TPA: secretin N-terminal domain-containing protein [Thermoanaerobaculia bacterium]
MPLLRRSALILSWALLLMVAATALSAAAPGAPDPKEIGVQVYTFKYQRASEAVAMVYPLLSPRGTIELQPGGNTLVIRDTAAAIRKVMPLLRSYDHPARALRLEIFVVRASRTTVSPQVQHSDLPEYLTQRLRGLLAYDNFEKQAQAQLAGAEGQGVVYELGPEYKVSFRFGTLGDDRRVKLGGFRISHRAEGRPETDLLHANLTLSLDHTTSLGLATSETSPEALILVLTLRDGEIAHR